jgi:hypothetical protein
LRTALVKIIIEFHEALYLGLVFRIHLFDGEHSDSWLEDFPAPLIIEYNPEPFHRYVGMIRAFSK